MAKNKIKAVVFDMDGVLIDAKEWHYESLNKALSHFGYSISRYDHLTTFDGLPTKKKLEMLTIEQGLPRALHQFLNDLKQAYTLEFVCTHCKPIFQHEFALSQLQKLGFRLGLASNSVRRTVELMMEKSQLLPYLDVVLSNQDVKHAKPSADIYLSAAQHLELEPKTCLVIEDNPNGVEAAKRAGCPVMVVESVYEVTLDKIMSAIAEIETT